MPQVFIGSSTHGLSIAEELERQLRLQGYAVSVWSRMFGPGGGTLQTLMTAAKTCDFAVLVLTGDDRIIRHGAERVLDVNALPRVPRDNIVFELGLFIGRLGPERAFAIVDRRNTPQLPTDLSGVTVIHLSNTGTLREAVAVVCQDLQRWMACAPRPETGERLSETSLARVIVELVTTRAHENELFMKLLKTLPMEGEPAA